GSPRPWGRLAGSAGGNHGGLAGLQLSPGRPRQLHEDVHAPAVAGPPPYLVEADLLESGLRTLVVTEGLEPHQVQAQVRERVHEQRAHRLGAVALRPVRLLADDDAQRRRARPDVVELGRADELVALVEDAEGSPVV